MPCQMLWKNIERIDRWKGKNSIKITVIAVSQNDHDYHGTITLIWEEPFSEKHWTTQWPVVGWKQKSRNNIKPFQKAPMEFGLPMSTWATSCQPTFLGHEVLFSTIEHIYSLNLKRWKLKRMPAAQPTSFNSLTLPKKHLSICLIAYTVLVKTL